MCNNRVVGKGNGILATAGRQGGGCLLEEHCGEPGTAPDVRKWISVLATAQILIRDVCCYGCCCGETGGAVSGGLRWKRGWGGRDRLRAFARICQYRQ
jgi:hypothetical protein